jgi:hypothetical protein
MNPVDPDYLIEMFWFGFKQSMRNFYETIDGYAAKYETFVVHWSNTLNNYKSNKDYMNIEHSIREYMSIYSFDLIKYSKSEYHDNIFITNIKRWNDISNSFNFNNSVKHSKIVILFMIYLQIKVLNDYDFLNKLQPIEEILKTENYDDFILYSITNNKPSILELIKKIPECNIYENIKKLYPTIQIKDNLSPIKIIQFIKKNLNK